MNVEILLIIIGLALIDTLSPTVIGITLYLLLREQRKLYRLLIVYLMTVAILYFLFGSALLLGISLSISFLQGLFQNRVISWTIFLTGIILFILSFYMPKRKAAVTSLPSIINSSSMIFLGVITFLIEGSTALPYFAAIGLMSTSNLNLFEWIPILILYNLIMVLPSLLLMIFYKLFSRLLNPLLQKLNNRLANSKESALSWVVCIVGLLLVFISLDYL
ncbi:GAP family protein [Psychrobacillus sp. FSL W7-1457]|uniref:GAP family protein n=1 Tax=unclassified Psychrobacillus TaxID=2636677 RepID=UPI0030FB710E